MTSYIQYGSPVLTVPSKMVGYDKQGNPRLYSTVSKTGSLKKHLGTNVFKVIPSSNFTTVSATNGDIIQYQKPSRKVSDAYLAKKRPIFLTETAKVQKEVKNIQKRIATEEKRLQNEIKKQTKKEENKLKREQNKAIKNAEKAQKKLERANLRAQKREATRAEKQMRLKQLSSIPLIQPF